MTRTNGNNMDDLTDPRPSISSSPQASALALELAKILKLVAPASMDAAGQLSWLASAIDALEGIHAHEVAAVSVEIRRSITRPNQIVPEIARLVAEKRARANRRTIGDTPQSREWEIIREANHRRAAARTQAEIEDVWEWERQARIDGGLAFAPRPLPLNAKEIRRLSPTMVKMGLKCGALVELNDGTLIDSAHQSAAR
jgi:hypothetical protein